MADRECDRCGKNTPVKELGRKVGGDYLCRNCKIKTRVEHREKTINDAGISEDLRELKNKYSREKNSERRLNNRKLRMRESDDNTINEVPIPKGSKIKKIIKHTVCYLTMQERQSFFRMLLSRGVSAKDAKERIQRLVDSQKELREELGSKSTSEDEIKSRQKEFLEELWT